MFKNLLGFWKGKDFLTQVLSDFNGMLTDTHTMFIAAYGNLFSNIEEPGLKDELYAIDRRVNKLQKEIRKRVVEHISLQPSVDTGVCLILMSVVKDAERLGDFSKNLFEIRQMLESPINRETYKGLFGNLDDDISSLFEKTKKAFIESDEEQATSTWEDQRKIKTRCNEILDTLLKSDLPVNEAVCFSLMTRYYKRIASHLTNIATSVVVPLEKLDYFDKGT
jgi:phosphate transport system protein